MKIDRNNYEPFFMDYLDGNLTAGEIDELIDFLSKNNDLAEELKDLDKIRINDENTLKYEGKSLLKNDLDMPDVFEEQCIRYIEGDITPGEKKILLREIRNNPEAKKELTLFQSTISAPDNSVTYKPKNKLLKNENPIVLRWWNVAAIIVLMFIVFSTRNYKSDEIYVADIIESSSVDNDNKTITNESIPDVTGIPIIEKENNKPAKTRHIIKTEIPVEINPVTEENTLPVIEISKLTPIENTLVYTGKSVPEYELISLNQNTLIREKTGKDYLTIGEFIAQKLNEFASKENLRKIRNSAFESIKEASEEKFTYTTNLSGEVKSIEYQSRLIAFSIPLASN